MSDDNQLKQDLGEERYQVIIDKQTELPFSGQYLHNNQVGEYLCYRYKTPLFSSDSKFESNSGWPSFNKPLASDRLKYIEDNSEGMHRIEVVCAKCLSHLGHVFDDAFDQPTQQRYCLNSVALDFDELSNK